MGDDEDVRWEIEGQPTYLPELPQYVCCPPIPPQSASAVESYRKQFPDTRAVYEYYSAARSRF